MNALTSLIKRNVSHTMALLKRTLLSRHLMIQTHEHLTADKWQIVSNNLERLLRNIFKLSKQFLFLKCNTTCSKQNT